MSEPYAPGVYDIPEADYFGASYALSCSGAKLLLPPSCPAKFRYEQDHPVHKDVFDFGSAAHKVVLGSGRDVAVLDYDNWQTKAAKQAREEARDAGQTPILRDAWVVVQAMAAAIQAHPLARALYDPARGRPEQSLFWTDPRTGIPMRARLDWLRDDGGRLIILDYKTASSAHPETFAKSAANYFYDMQDAFYGDGARALGLDTDPAFLFVAQEKTPPYLVSVVELDSDARRAGRARNRQATDTYIRCIESGDWPGYVADDEIELISLPHWARPREDAF